MLSFVKVGEAQALPGGLQGSARDGEGQRAGRLEGEERTRISHAHSATARLENTDLRTLYSDHCHFLGQLLPRNRVVRWLGKHQRMESPEVHGNAWLWGQRRT